jgi:hypothetical protein
VEPSSPIECHSIPFESSKPPKRSLESPNPQKLNPESQQALVS